jgi:hypothetical protein
MNTSAAPAEPSERAQWTALLAAPLLCSVVAFAALPRPQAVDQARASVDRGALDFVAKTAPKADRTVNAALGDKIQLVGITTPPAALRRGESFTVKTDWKVLKTMDRTWEMFVHIDLKGGRHRIHGDHAPTGGQYPTPMWQEGEVVSDVWNHRVPLDAPRGSYDIFIGLYIGDERMGFSGGDKALHAGDNRLRIGSLTIK